MIKKNLKILMITSAIILLPIFAGLILWNQLPEQMPIHWNAAGEVDGVASKAFTVFCLPLIFLGLQWIATFATYADPKRQNHPQKILQLMFWIIPVLAVILTAITYVTALGRDISVESLIPILLGLLFVVIGNYMPKCKHNYTVGIKIPWTLASEENWNRTHRFAGWIWVVGGLLMTVSGFFNFPAIVLIAALIMVFVPTVYSFVLYKKGI